MTNLKYSPRIFVGSSSEAENIDRQIRRIIENLGAQAIGWRDVFKLGDYTLDVLVNLASSIDGALLIVTPDDPSVYKSTDRMSPRDNVIFELGIFISQLGKKRTGIIHVVDPDKPAASLPTDLHGLTVIKYSSAKPVNNEYQLEVWLKDVLSYCNDKNPYVDELIDLLSKKVNSLPFSWREIVEEHVVKAFKSSIHLALKGEIYLSPGKYYHALYSEIDNANPQNEILAVATLSSLIWKGDPEQQDYLEKNLKAAGRGANIRRLFILPDNQWNQIGAVLKKQIDKGINIRRASTVLFGEFSRIEDMVVFKNSSTNESRAYIAEPEINRSRIRRGRLIINEDIKSDLIDTFEKVWAISTEISLSNIPKVTKAKKSTISPWVNLKEYRLDKSVISCDEAALAKGISLENELKTLLLKTSIGYVALELPGDSTASLRKIKDALDVKQAHLADKETLLEFRLEPGTVSAVRPPIWGLPHLVSKRLLTLEFLSTNSGHKKGFYRFPPSLLLEAETVMIGDFEEEYMNEKV